MHTIKIAIGLSALFANAVFGSVTFNIHAQTGMQPHGVSAGQLYSQFDLPMINNAGQIAFRGQVDGPGVNVTNAEGVWAGLSGQLTLAFRKGDDGIMAITDAAQNDVNGVAIGGWIGTARSLLTRVPGQPSKVLYEGSTSLPYGGGTVAVLSVNRIRIGGNGSAVANVSLGGSFGMANGIIVATEAGTSVVAGPGQALPVSDTTLSGFLGDPFVDDAGHVFFRPSVTESQRPSIIVRASGTNLAVVTSTYDPRNGPPQPGDIVGLSNFTVNGNGDVAYLADVETTGLRVAQLRLANDGGDSLIASQRGKVSDSDQRTYQAFSSTLAMNRRGDLIANVQLNPATPPGAATPALALFSTGATRLLADVDVPVPQLAGLRFAGDAESATINDVGQAAFVARIAGSGVNSSNNTALFATLPNGDLQLVVQKGQAFDLDPSLLSDLRIISSIGLLGGTSAGGGSGHSFNDDGTLVFRLSFTDGSSAIVSTSVVPEPAVPSLLAITGLLMLSRRRSGSSRHPFN